MASDEPREEEWAWLPFYPLRLPTGDGIAEVIVDFSAITAMAMAKDAIGRLAKSKRWEMTDEARASFRTKLAVFVGRP